MKYNQLDLTPKSPAKRVGRGIASGKGKTAGRGTKGQKARTGATRSPGFSGGQNPLMQQLPKLPGFKSHYPKNNIVTTSQLDSLDLKTVDNAVLAEKGLIKQPYTNVKVLFDAPLKQIVNLKLQGASAKAIDAISKAGGSFEKVPLPMRPSSKAK